MKTLYEKIGERGIVEEDFAINPDEVDIGELWAEQLDNGGNSMCGNPEATDEESIIFYNSVLARSTGLFNGIPFLTGRVVDIGAGYGTVAKCINSGAILISGQVSVRELDIVPRTQNTFLVSGHGEIPANDAEVDAVFSSNVFQHCTEKMRAKYFEEAARVLKVGGYFNFGTLLDCGDETPNTYQGRNYCASPGYLTPWPTQKEILELMDKNNFVGICSTTRRDGYASYCFRKVESGKDN